MVESLLVGGPFAGEEDEAIEHHAGAKDGDVFYGFLEDNVDVAVHGAGVGQPPEVDPVRVDLLGVSAGMGRGRERDGPGGLR